MLNSRFDRLALALEGNAQSGDPELEQQPRDVFLTKAPMPLRPGGATSVCNGTPAGNFEANLKAVETQWLIDRVVNPLNARFATEATQHGWHIVDTHVDRFHGHAICNLAPDNWINQNLQALRKQGELDETEGLPIAVSGGIAHPNRDGYAVIGAALHERMREVFMDHYTPDSAPATTTNATATGFTRGRERQRAGAADVGLLAPAPAATRSTTTARWSTCRTRPTACVSFRTERATPGIR